MFDRREALDSEIVGDQHGKPAVRDPLQQAPVAAVEDGATIMRKLVIDAAIVAQQQIGVAGMQADEVAGLDLDLVPLDDFHQRVVADDHASLVAVAFEIDQDPAPLHAGRRHAFDAQSSGGRSGLGLEYAEGSGLSRIGRTDDVLAGAKAVVITSLRHAVPVRVEHEAEMRERVPMGGILGVQHCRVVADEVGRIGIVIRDAIVHPRPAIAERRAQHRRIAARAQDTPARPIERQAQAECDPLANLARGCAHPFGRQEVDPTELVVGPEVPPVRSFWSHTPPLRHSYDLSSLRRSKKARRAASPSGDRLSSVV
jgi:hypothetical protein